MPLYTYQCEGWRRYIGVLHGPIAFHHIALSISQSLYLTLSFFSILFITGLVEHMHVIDNLPGLDIKHYNLCYRLVGILLTNYNQCIHTVVYRPRRCSVTVAPVDCRVFLFLRGVVGQTDHPTTTDSRHQPL